MVVRFKTPIPAVCSCEDWNKWVEDVVSDELWVKSIEEGEEIYRNEHVVLKKVKIEYEEE